MGFPAFLTAGGEKCRRVAMNSMQTNSLALTIDPDRPELTLWDRGRNQRLLFAPDFALFCPVVDGSPVHPRLVDTVSQPAEITFLFDAPPLVDFQVHVKRAADHLEISSRFGVAADCELNRLELFPSGTGLNLYDVVNFRNRHHTPNTWPELNLGGEGLRDSARAGRGEPFEDQVGETRWKTGVVAFAGVRVLQ